MWCEQSWTVLHRIDISFDTVPILSAGPALAAAGWTWWVVWNDLGGNFAASSVSSISTRCRWNSELGSSFRFFFSFWFAFSAWIQYLCIPSSTVMIWINKTKTLVHARSTRQLMKYYKCFRLQCHSVPYHCNRTEEGLELSAPRKKWLVTKHNCW